jgi:acyl-coenzyme A synthetase/AMP-(fatty) acid ligase
MSQLSLGRLLSDGYPDEQPVAQYTNGTVPFRTFRADVAAATARLEGCPHAALVCDDSYLFAVGLFALWYAGAAILLPANSQPGTLATLDVPIIDDRWLSRFPPAQRPFQSLDPSQCRVVLHTSGSTGTAKCIAKTLNMLQSESAAIQRAFGAQSGSGPVFATVTHQHLYGLTFRLLWPLAAGRLFDATTDAVWETLLPRLRRGAMIVSSPAHLGRLGGLRPAAERPAMVLSAGAPLTVEAAHMTAAIFGSLPTEIFGSTETGVIASRRQVHGGEDWTLLPGNKIRTDAEGRMAVHPAYMDGWQQTQDVIEPTAGGFRFLGRADRIVKIEGERVSLPELEAALENLPQVAEAAVVALPETPVRLGAVLVLTADGHALLSDLGSFRFGRLLRRLLSASFEPACLPRTWHFTDAIPVRAMGKRNDIEIAALFARRPV